ncbi:MAG: outer membrane beta-barrel protein [Rhizobacter sp.]|nr:outer membrane beta-barrel protein [Rhizobacter sp.]
MNRLTRSLTRFGAATAVAAACLLAAGTASAQSYAPSFAGASLAATDYGTGLKVYLGGMVTPIFGWEGQIASLGSETYAGGYEHSAIALGGSGLARFALAPQLSAFGKAGLHYLRRKDNRPAGNADNSIELGLGAGLLWNFSHTAALRLEFENIGGSDGDLASIGLQFSF